MFIIDIVINIEIRNKINIYSKIIQGPGGMPVGTAEMVCFYYQEELIALLQDIWLQNVECTLMQYISMHHHTHLKEQNRKLSDLAKIISKYTGPMNLYVVNFTDIQMYIYDKCPHDELTIIMRRYMMRIAEYFANKEGSLGLITGESIGQVASQTMQSLAATNEVCTMPVFRPVIAFDKQEIVDISLKIGTYETSILPYEDCCTTFVAKHPVTKPNINIIKRSETHLEEEIDRMFKEAVETAELIEIRRD